MFSPIAKRFAGCILLGAAWQYTCADGVLDDAISHIKAARASLPQCVGKMHVNQLSTFLAQENRDRIDQAGAGEAGDYDWSIGDTGCSIVRKALVPTPDGPVEKVLSQTYKDWKTTLLRFNASPPTPGIGEIYEGFRWRFYPTVGYDYKLQPLAEFVENLDSATASEVQTAEGKIVEIKGRYKNRNVLIDFVPMLNWVASRFEMYEDVQGGRAETTYQVRKWNQDGGFVYAAEYSFVNGLSRPDGSSEEKFIVAVDVLSHSTSGQTLRPTLGTTVVDRTNGDILRVGKDGTIRPWIKGRTPNQWLMPLGWGVIISCMILCIFGFRALFKRDLVRKRKWH
jgi:hypothetical protein